ncbi:hypothetical protein [Candidatus Protochlamydia phocaeensis]|uniref:hypothetical protein n=1 Tax=Candidatus Protochlamydia phocaeensis TaxID=1414722 RepID=UPI000837B9E5|nr:hypothetical protein [Candidatus Protochlamydia phocaeensis]
MKLHPILTALFITINVFTLPLWADGDVTINPTDFSSENINQAKPPQKTPFSLTTLVDSIGNSKIERGHFKGDNIRFAEASAEVGSVVYYCPAYSEGANIALRYTATYIKWLENPWFDQQHFHTITLSFGGVTKRIDKWFWRTQLSINYDAGSKFDTEYINYDLILWGRYEYCRDIGLHVGFLAQTGMRLDRVYPIIGADWQISRDWKLNLVFPVNVSLEYAITPHWFFVLAGRNFDSRHRVKAHESHHKALIRYENIGAEVAIKYAALGMTANIHAGTTLGGCYRLADRHNHHPNHYYLQPAGYVGGEIDVKF